MEFIPYCIICNEKVIDQRLDLKNCEHKPFCRDCLISYFINDGNTTCPYCAKSVGNKITFGDGVITMRFRDRENKGSIGDTRCMVCYLVNENGIRCPCGCDCLACDSCIDLHGKDNLMDFCFCAKSRSETPYHPPVHVIKSLENKRNSEKLEIQNGYIQIMEEIQN